MNEEPSPPPSTAFDLNELARLNEELRQLRESVKRKRLEREAAKREGKRAIVDLGPELVRLNRFIEELDQLREKLKSSAIPKTDREASGAEPLRNVLLQMQNQLVTEKDRLAEENAIDQCEEELKRQADEIRALREELAKDRKTLEKERESLELTLSQVKEEQARLKSMSAEMHRDQSQEELKRQADEIRALREELAKDRKTLEKERESLELTLSQVKEEQARLKSMSAEMHREIAEPTRIKPAYDYGKAEELEDRKLEFLIDQLSVIKAELRDVREHLAKEERTLETKQRELDEERYDAREEKRASEAMVTREIATMKCELEKFREQLAKEQEIVESRRNELARGKERIEEERKALETRIANAQDDFAKRTIQRIRNELQSERMEFGSLRKSIDQIKVANLRERKIIERDRDAILRVQIKLEREKQKIAQKAALLELRERRVETTGTQRGAKPREIRKKRGPRTRERGWTMNHPAVEQLGREGPIEGERVILGVKLGTEDYGIDTTQVREIIRMREITPLPRQPPYVEGVMNVRGAIIPVVSLKKRFGLQENGSKHQHIVIVESAKGSVGMLVDAVSEVIRVPAQQISPAPQVTKGIDGEYLHGICRLGEKLMIYLDLEKLLEQAVPVDRTAGLQLLLSRRSDLSELNKDEQRIINAIPKAGRTKPSLRRRVRFSAGKLDRLISSLLDKELIEVTRVGNSKLIRRTNS